MSQSFGGMKYITIVQGNLDGRGYGGQVKSKRTRYLCAGPGFTEIAETNLETEPKLRLPMTKCLEILSFAVHRGALSKRDNLYFKWNQCR